MGPCCHRGGWGLSGQGPPPWAWQDLVPHPPSTHAPPAKFDIPPPAQPHHQKGGQPPQPPKDRLLPGNSSSFIGDPGTGTCTPPAAHSPAMATAGPPASPPPAPAPYTWVSCSSRSVAVPGSGGPLRGPPSPSSLASRAWGASTLPGGSFLGVLVPMGDTEDVCFVMSHHSTPGGSRVRLVGPAGKGVRWWGGVEGEEPRCWVTSPPGPQPHLAGS